jgi:hypothetical protein
MQSKANFSSALFSAGEEIGRQLLQLGLLAPCFLAHKPAPETFPNNPVAGLSAKRGREKAAGNRLHSILCQPVVLGRFTFSAAPAVAGLQVV